MNRFRYPLLAGLLMCPVLAFADGESVHGKADTLWVLVAAALVFFMQAGFMAFEVGLVRTRHITSVAVKNVIDWVVGSILFLLLGFGLMFGHSAGGWIGTDLFLLNGVGEALDGHPTGLIFFLFQAGFLCTSLTIISGAMAERTSFTAYLSSSALVALLIYPIFGHWTWGNLYFADNAAWLADLGFVDFAGSTVVHSVGAWVALAGALVVGPRLGRYNQRGQLMPFEVNNLPMAVLGVFILWLGWWGFNGGSTLGLTDRVGVIITNTTLAAAAAGLTSFYHCYLTRSRSDLYPKLLGGLIGGLVAITACCDVVTPLGALLVGGVAGVICNFATDFLAQRARIDDPVGAIAVHGICGVWGTLAVALIGQSERLPLPRWQQLGIQGLGIVVCFVFTFTVAYLIFRLLKATIGLRVSPLAEREGTIIGQRQITSVHYDDEALLKDDLIRLMREAEGGSDSSSPTQPDGTIPNPPTES